jgi:hypothetical protein
MDNTWMAKHFIDFQRTTFNQAFQTLAMLQDHTAKVTHSLIEQAGWLPEKNRKIMGEWTDMVVKGRDVLKKAVNENFDHLADAMASAPRGGFPV